MQVAENWLDLVPTCSDVYVFQAALVCEDCAAKIMKRLDKQGVEDDGDSDTYPQGPHGDGGGEADSAEFCDSGRECVNAVRVAGTKIGCPLGNPLTSDGAAAVKESIRRSLLDPKKYSRMIGRLIRQVWRDYVSNEDYVGPAVMPQVALPASVMKVLGAYSRQHGVVYDEHHLVLDADHAYFVAQRAGEVDVLRLPTNDEGEFKTVDAVTMPAAVFENRDARDVVAEAISEGAWD